MLTGMDVTELKNRGLTELVELTGLMDLTELIHLQTKSVDDINLGDLIELSRWYGLYAHWAVYVGNGDVIHLSPPPSDSTEVRELCSIMASSGIAGSGVTSFGSLGDFKNFKVRRDPLKVVAAGSAIVVNNECDNEMSPYPGAEIVKRAESKLGTNSYNLLTWNCEHFATWCRYGKAVSKQVGNVSKGLSVDAYLVQLPGVEVIPPGTLPGNILAIDLMIKEPLPSLTDDKERTIKTHIPFRKNTKEHAFDAKVAHTFSDGARLVSESKTMYQTKMDFTKFIYMDAKSVDDINLGDLIELSRYGGLYAHWVVYVGNGEVIHLSPPPSVSTEIRDLYSVVVTASDIARGDVTPLLGLVGDSKAIKVRRDPLKAVAAGSAIIVNNECDYEMRPFPGAEIVKRAESKLGTNSYNLLTWNCEHFATWCRYGKAVSKQADNVIKSLSADAYLVHLPGVEIIPPGTLPPLIYLMTDPISVWVEHRRRTIKELKLLAETLKHGASIIQATAATAASTSTASGFSAAMCFIAAPFTGGLSLIPAGIMTDKCITEARISISSKLIGMVADNPRTNDAQKALNEDRNSFEKLKECVMSAKQTHNEKIVVRSTVAVKLVSLGKTARFAGHADAIELPSDIVAFVKNAVVGNNSAAAADKVLELARKLEEEYDYIMLH